MTQLVLYTSEDGQAQVQLRAERGTVWLTQLEMAELFDASKQNISLHLKNIYQEGELESAATVKESLTVQTEGGREVRRPLMLYNLEAILAVGYRVRSPRGVQFRRWASTVLVEYLRKGFVMDDERLKNPDGRPDYLYYDQPRQAQEAQAADAQDEAELQALESRIKQRKRTGIL
ncbi:MAG: virulence RhuM family protein [Magnetococcales bacterium]|nr:virulence RhuM family protein [Magnetococcales bacterium]